MCKKIALVTRSHLDLRNIICPSSVACNKFVSEFLLSGLDSLIQAGIEGVGRTSFLKREVLAVYFYLKDLIPSGTSPIMTINVTTRDLRKFEIPIASKAFSEKAYGDFVELLKPITKNFAIVTVKQDNSRNGYFYLLKDQLPLREVVINRYKEEIKVINENVDGGDNSLEERLPDGQTERREDRRG